MRKRLFLGEFCYGDCRVYSFRATDWMIKMMDLLIEKGIFLSRSEFIRHAINLAIKRLLREGKITKEEIREIIERQKEKE